MSLETTYPNGLPFLKMHGLGNDFVIIDARGQDSAVHSDLAQAIGDRLRGVGFDQLAVLNDAADADVDVTFWNSDGSRADACGNASRCVGRLLTSELSKDNVTLKTGRGLLPVQKTGENMFRVNMGEPLLTWREVPLSDDVDLIALPIEGAPSAVGMGNPHCVFVVEDAEAVNLPKRGPEIEHHPLFPERTNVEFVHIIDPQTIRMRVWERGGIITQACGSGACAAVVATARRDLTDRNVAVHLDGGILNIDWTDEGVWMEGTTALVFEGRLSPEFLANV